MIVAMYCILHLCYTSTRNKSGFIANIFFFIAARKINISERGNVLKKQMRKTTNTSKKGQIVIIAIIVYNSNN